MRQRAPPRSPHLQSGYGRQGFQEADRGGEPRKHYPSTGELGVSDGRVLGVSCSSRQVRPGVPVFRTP